VATTTRYVNTASTSGGNGTTNATSGTDRAYASLSEAEAACQGTVNSGDVYQILCCGTTADTTAVEQAGWTINGELQIKANSGDSAGKYTGNTDWSSSHYRLEISGSAHALYLNNSSGTGTVVVDGLQVDSQVTSGSYSALRMNRSNQTVKNCRFKHASSAFIAIYQTTGTNCFLLNNILASWGSEAVVLSLSSGGVAYVYNNTACNNRVTSNTRRVFTYGLTTGATYHFVNNVCITDNANGITSYSGSGTPTIYRSYNAGPNCASADSAGGISIKGSTWTSHVENVANGDLRPKTDGTGALDGAGQSYTNDNNVPQTDITGATRSAWDIGAFYYASGSLTAVTDTLDARWHLREAVADALDARWAIRQAVADTLDAQWDIRQAVADALDARWPIRQAVADALDARWPIRQAVADTLDARWAVRQAVADTLYARWDILSALTTVSDALDLRWHIRQAVADSLDARWDILSVVEAVTDALDLRWDIRSPVTDSLDARWHIRRAVADQLLLLWALGDTIDREGRLFRVPGPRRIFAVIT
jgi:hypothetical protein